MSKLPFEREIGDMLEKMYPLVGRCPDVRGRRFTSPKKMDYWSCNSEGKFIADECKATQSNVFPFSKIPGHQRKALTTVMLAGGESYLDLNFRGKQDPGKAWRIPWECWLKMEEGWPKKSIRMEETEQQFWRYELRRISGGWEIPNVVGPRITRQ